MTWTREPARRKMKLHGLTPVVSLISSAESAEALTRLRSSSYGGSVRRIHPRAYAQGLLRRRINGAGERCGLTAPYPEPSTHYFFKNSKTSAGCAAASATGIQCFLIVPSGPISAVDRIGPSTVSPWAFFLGPQAP